MVTITLHCPHCQSDALVRNGHAPMGNNCIAVVRADVKAARTRLPSALKRFQEYEASYIEKTFQDYGKDEQA